MNTIYLKFTSGYDLQKGHNNPPMGYVIKTLVSDITGSTNDTIFSISSSIYNKDELLTKFKSYGTSKEITELNEIEAHILGKLLRPDETDETDETDDEPYSFDNIIPMDLTKAKAVKNNEINYSSGLLMKWACDNDIAGTYSDEVNKITLAGRKLRDSVNECSDYQSIIDIIDTR